MGKLRPGAGPLETIGTGIINKDPVQVGDGLVGTAKPNGPALKKSNIPNGAWLPHVGEVARIVNGTFGLTPSTYSGHGVQPGGMATAIDFVMPSGWNKTATGDSKAKGDALIAWVEANWQPLNINYVIWYDRIKGVQTGGKWIPYPAEWKAAYGTNDGSPSVLHTDHGHLSFNQSGAMPDISKLKAPGGIGAELSNVGQAAGGALDWMSNIPEWIAQGIANGFLRFIKAVYGYTILRPLDFAGGFAWELAKRVSGYTDQATTGEGTDPDVFSDKNKNRLWTLGFLFATYYLAFGRDRATGEHHLDKLLAGGGDLLNRDLQGTGSYNDVARVTAGLKGVTVARRRARHTTRRSAVSGSGNRPTGTRVSGSDARRDAGGAATTKDRGGVTTDGSGTVKRRTRGTPVRDSTTGRFTGTRKAPDEEAPVGRGEGEGAAKRDAQGKPKRTTDEQG